mmetsp:Transcript_27148/g.38224  ORF Transcript_27148/g.38224 Transcript_27148/m.38224 type:complete len:242 (-) Transcript_27148:954-1679(-)
MSRNIHYIINTTTNPIIAILVSFNTISGKIVALVSFHVCCQISIMSIVNSSCNGWPRRGNNQHTAHIISLQNSSTCCIENLRFNAKERHGCRTGFRLDGTWKRSEQMGTTFGLPIGINNSALPFTDDIVVPFPSFWVDRFSNRPQNSERRAIILFDEIVTELHKSPDCCWCSIKLCYLVSLNHVPVSSCIRGSWKSFKHKCGSTITQGAINNVTMSCNPTNICYASIHVTRMIIENISVCQ